MNWSFVPHVQWCHRVELTPDVILCYLGEVFAYPNLVELKPKFIPKVFLQPFVGNTTVSHASAGTNEVARMWAYRFLQKKAPNLSCESSAWRSLQKKQPFLLRSLRSNG